MRAMHVKLFTPPNNYPHPRDIMEQMRSHSGVQVREKDAVTGKVRTVLSAQCTDTWHKRARLDNVSIKYTDDAGDEQSAFARLLLLFTYRPKGSRAAPEQLALVHWYAPAKREGFRPVRISEHYLKQCKLTDDRATDVVDISAITAVAHIIPDLQATVPQLVKDRFLSARYFVNDGNKRCL